MWITLQRDEHILLMSLESLLLKLDRKVAASQTDEANASDITTMKDVKES